MKIPMTLSTANVESALKTALTQEGLAPVGSEVRLLGFTRAKGPDGPSVVSAQVEVDTDPLADVAKSLDLAEAPIEAKAKPRKPAPAASPTA